MIAERMNAALNARDIDAFVALFAPAYDSVQPAHPDRAFVGAEQVRKNWTEVFAGVPDFRAELVRATTDGDTEWSEWRWSGTGLEMVGVTLMGIRDERVAWARLYVEHVEAGEGIEAAVREMTGD
jgi:SnoaL-like protein